MWLKGVYFSKGKAFFVKRSWMCGRENERVRTYKKSNNNFLNVVYLLWTLKEQRIANSPFAKINFGFPV